MGLGPQALQEIARVNHPIRSPSAFRSFLFAQIERERGREREREREREKEIAPSWATGAEIYRPSVSLFTLLLPLLFCLLLLFFSSAIRHSRLLSFLQFVVFFFLRFLFLLFPLCLCLLVSYLCFVSSSNLFSISRSFFNFESFRLLLSSFFYLSKYRWPIQDDFALHLRGHGESKMFPNFSGNVTPRFVRDES